MQIFVNGWNTGPYVGDVGPQQEFVILSGFLVQSPSGG
ncbi:beta galactosidase jelly roll domain-containing protein [Streptomyces prasinus]